MRPNPGTHGFTTLLGSWTALWAVMARAFYLQNNLRSEANVGIASCSTMPMLSCLWSQPAVSIWIDVLTNHGSKKLRFLDLPLLDLHRMVDCSDDPGTPKGVKTIVYAGSLPKGIRSPRFFLNVLSCMPEEPLRVVFVGDAANDDLNAAASSDRRIEIRGRLSHGDAVALLRSADFVLTLRKPPRQHDTLESVRAHGLAQTHIGYLSHR